jgi:thiol:disulfide interchange protein DsbC
MSRFVLCLFCLSLFLPIVALADPASEAQGAQLVQLKAVATALALAFPNIPLKQLSATPIEGIYEIIAQNDEILYFAPGSGHIFVGEIWNTSGQNLTRESKNRLMTAKLALLPLDIALKIGNGPNQVVEVSDPDCPFCRDGSAFFSGRADVTRYIFLFPLDKIHPQAEAKARYILSAEDPEAAYEEVFSGAYDKQPLPEFKDNGRLDSHREIAQKIGINSTPRYWINGSFVSGSNFKEFEKMLNK